AKQAVGALYGLVGPDREALRKALRPPGEWQTLDVTFHAPRVDDANRVTEPGRVRVALIGVVVIADGRLDRTSPQALDGRLGTPGSVLLQDHGAKVRFRVTRIRPLTVNP